MRPSVGLVVSIGASLDLNNLKEKEEKGEKAANGIAVTSWLELWSVHSENPEKAADGVGRSKARSMGSWADRVK